MCLNRGDKVICIARFGGPEMVSPLPHLGRAYRVLQVTTGTDSAGERRFGIRIFAEDAEMRRSWRADDFRKVETADDAFTAQVRRCRPYRPRRPVGA